MAHSIVLPLLVFLLVTGAVTLLGHALSTRRHGSTRALKQRLGAVVQHRAIRDETSLLADNEHQSRTEAWLIARLPGMAALNLTILRSGRDFNLSQVLALCCGIALAGAVLFGGLSGSYLIGLAFAPLLGGLPLAVLGIATAHRRRKLEEQLPEALDFITRALRAGHGITIALGMVADELRAPIGPEFKKTFDEINFGLPFNEALANMSHRVGSGDLDFFVVAVLIQRETGGNLTDILASLSRTVRERMKLHGKVRVLASEGKFSGILLGALPFVMGGVMTLLNPKYMAVLWTTPTGHKLIVTGIGMMLAGFVWMWKIAQIKV